MSLISTKTPPNWQQVKLADVFDFIRTCSHSKDKMIYSEGNNHSVYNIHYGDIHALYSDYVDFNKNGIPFLSDNAEVIPEDKFLKDGDLVVVDASEDYDGVGSAVELKNVGDKRCIAGLHVFALRDKSGKTAPGYRRLTLLHPQILKRLKQVSTYSKVYGISKSSFSQVDLILPPLPEQNRIVAVLETWDNTIDLLNKKIELKKQVKKGLMQRLLSGEVRLPGFSGKWKTVKLGDVCTIKTGKKDVNQGNPEGEFPFFTCARQHTYSDVYSFDTEAILIAGNGDVGNCQYYKGKFEAYQRTYVLSDFTNIVTEFIFPYLLYFFQNHVSNQKQMGAMPYIKLGMLKDFPICLPSKIEEQEAIASILTTADNEIDLLEQKLHALEQQKKFLLNNLVTGEIRTPEDMAVTTT